jgi:uncharacterized protein YjbJ (UPF0337 family)
MSIASNITHKAEALKDSAMRIFGRATGSRRLRAKGPADQGEGDIKHPGAKIQDASGH